MEAMHDMADRDDTVSSRAVGQDVPANRTESKAVPTASLAGERGRGQ